METFILSIVMSAMLSVGALWGYSIGKNKSKQLSAPAIDSDDVIVYLEVQSTLGSAIAKQLLNSTKALSSLQEQEQEQIPEHWALFLKDIQQETSDDERLECLKQWINRGTKFSNKEIVDICALFACAEGRDAARENHGLIGIWE